MTAAGRTNTDTVTAASSNTIQNNGTGIVVSNSANARIIGNTIQTHSADGIVVSRDSSADIASNSINANGNDGIKVSENATVQLGEDSGTSI